MARARDSLSKARVAAFLVVAAGGLLALALVAAGDSRAFAFTLGVPPGQVAAELRPGQTACQAPILVSSEFSRLRFQVGTYGRRGEPLELVVRSFRSGRALGQGRLRGGYLDVSQPSVPVGRVAPDQPVEVCIRNGGERKVALYGGTTAAAPGTDARVEGAETGTDLTLVFERAEPRSMLATVPDVFRRASVFRPGWVGSWTFWALAVLLGAGVPALLALALARATDGGAAPGRTATVAVDRKVSQTEAKGAR
jgi:hypothetical protein